MGETDEIGELVQAAEAYCRQHGIAESTLGRMAVNDGKLIGRLRGGGTITLKTAGKLRSFLLHPPFEAVQP